MSSVSHWFSLGLFLALASAARADEPSLSVEAAVQEALRAGDVLAHQQRIEEARGRLRQRMARPNPVVVYDRQDIFGAGAAPGFVQDLVKVEQPLLSGAVRDRRRRAGEREVDAAASEVGVATQRKVYEVRRAFARALEAQEVAGVYAAATTRVEAARSLVAVRVEAGESSQYERVRVDLAEAQERDLASSARVELSRALAELGAAMSSTVSPDTRLRGTLPGAIDLPDRPPAPRRPEIALDEARLAQARAEEDVIRAELRPQLSTGLGYMRFDQSGLTQQDGYNAIVSVNLPVGDRREGDRRAARARSEAARLTRMATEGRLRAELEGARAHLVTANARLRELLTSQGARMGEMLSIAETSYRAGLQTLLELLDAYRLERDFRIARVRAQGVLLLAMEDYARALGTTPDELWPLGKENNDARDGK